MQLLTALGLTAVFGLLSSLTEAAGLPLVVSTTVDSAHNTITINGQNFGSNPIITIGSLKFSTAAGSSSTQIIANFPPANPGPGFTPGTYLLTMQFSNQLPSIYTVNIGAQGAAGPQGPIGPQGPAGASGAQGIAGPAGTAGPQGSPGPMGPAGLKGDAGPAGPQGIAGLNGAKGVDGAQGPAGPQGPKGDTGPQGPSGSGGSNTPGVVVRAGLIDLTDVASPIATFPALPVGAYLLTLTASVTTLGNAVAIDCSIDDNLAGNDVDTVIAAFPGDLRSLSISRAISTFGGHDVNVECRSQTLGGTARVTGMVAIATPVPGSYILDY